jgi:F0F1-type ATP synthase membrane subunit c/vacuolar-type H+-ATPase subunit K
MGYGINIGIALLCASSCLAQTPASSVVYVAHNPDAIEDYETNSRIVHGMVDRLVLAVTGQPDIAKAWSSLVGPKDRIGIKISAAGGELFTTHRDVVKAIVDGLVAAGHTRDNIIVWDRSIAGAKAAGYKSDAGDYQLKSVAPRDGYDAKAIFSAPVIGNLVWGDLEFQADKGRMQLAGDDENTSNLSHFARIISNDVTKIINVPLMSNSGTNGLAGCLYNVTIPNLDNWRRFAQGSGFGIDSIAEIYSNPLVGKKVVLNLMDGLVGVYAGGPQSQPNYSVHHATLYASKDPVAIDSIALKKLDEWRVQGKFPPTGRQAEYLKYATEIGLGNSQPNRIEIKNVGR